MAELEFFYSDWALWKSIRNTFELPNSNRFFSRFLTERVEIQFELLSNEFFFCSDWALWKSMRKTFELPNSNRIFFNSDWARWNSIRKTFEWPNSNLFFLFSLSALEVDSKYFWTAFFIRTERAEIQFERLSNRFFFSIRTERVESWFERVLNLFFLLIRTERVEI